MNKEKQMKKLLVCIVFVSVALMTEVCY